MGLSAVFEVAIVDSEKPPSEYLETPFTPESEQDANMSDVAQTNIGALFVISDFDITVGLSFVCYRSLYATESRSG